MLSNQLTSHTTSGSVRRLAAAPTPEEFFDGIVWANRPVVIRGLADRWRREQCWTPDALASILGERAVRITRSHGAYDFDRDRDNWFAPENDTMMPFTELAREMSSTAPPGECLYLHQKSIPEKFPELLDNIHVPELVPEGSLMMSNLWAGTGGNVSSLHFDQPNNFLFQLYGRKRLLLFDPFQLPYLYPSTRIPHFSRVNPECPDTERFPEFAKASSLDVELGPGDTLFLPPFWWHQVYSLSASVSVNMFWTAYTHQLLAPAMMVVLPELYPDIAEKYGRYLPGRLHQLIDFAGYALAAGFDVVAAVFACAALQQLLQRASSQTPGIAGEPKLPAFDQAPEIIARLVAAQALSAGQGVRVRDWIEDGRRALDLVASTASAPGLRQSAEEMISFVGYRAAQESETVGSVYLEI